MSVPQVSVAMGVCNVERFLAEAIESVLGQTLEDLEFIIVDFGSTDGSKAIVRAYAGHDSRIKVSEISPCGLAEARNAACARAQGRYLAVMDADDVCLPHRLESEVEFMEKNPDVGLVGGATDWIDSTGRSLGVHEFPIEHSDIKLALETRFPFCHPTILMRQSAFQAVGGYRKPFAAAQDYDLGVRISERFRCANLPQVVLKYRIHPQQISLQKQEQQTFGRLAAQASAQFRRSAKPDPLDSANEISRETLAAMGVSDDRLQSILAADRRNWIRSMSAAGEYSAALAAASELLESNQAGVESWQIADLQLTMAHLYWKQGDVVGSAAAAARAVMKRPLVLGRPLKALLRRTREDEN
jgi:hypothetical protein